MGLINPGHNVPSGQSTSNEVDGRRAWFTLACVFVMNGTTLGALKIYGLIFEEIVDQKYYTRAEASWPISTASTIQNLAGLITPILALKISWRAIEVIQTLLFVIANSGAYLSNSLGLDIFFLGIVQGVALSLRYNMNVVINNEYFALYRTTAMGVSLAGSTCGVFVLKPIIAHIIDNSDNKFRNAYLALACIMSLNLCLNTFIRKPLTVTRPGTPESDNSDSFYDSRMNDSGSNLSLATLIKSPALHCVWIMQTVYFYISRTYTIFIVDYGVDQGFGKEMSRNLLDFWVYGEIFGRLGLGALVDAKFLKLKWNIIVVNFILSLAGFVLIGAPIAMNSSVDNQTKMYWIIASMVCSTAALSSLVNMMIVPFAQEYLGKKNVPWAFALGSVITSLFLLIRPSIIGLSRDYYKSYMLLIGIMSSGPLFLALCILVIEPYLRVSARNRTQQSWYILY